MHQNKCSAHAHTGTQTETETETETEAQTQTQPQTHAHTHSRPTMNCWNQASIIQCLAVGGVKGHVVALECFRKLSTKFASSKPRCYAAGLSGSCMLPELSKVVGICGHGGLSGAQSYKPCSHYLRDQRLLLFPAFWSLAFSLNMPLEPKVRPASLHAATALSVTG